MDNSQMDRVVMTVKNKTDRSTTLVIERRPATETGDSKAHVAGGDHEGIIINKGLAQDPPAIDKDPPRASLEFRVFLVDAQSGKHVQEKRLLQYWFGDTVSAMELTAVAQEFFKALVSPQEFPRDYVGFIMKIIKLMQHGFPGISKLEVTLTQLDSLHAPPVRPSEERRPAEVLELIEAAYPNPVTVDELAGSSGRNVGALNAQLAQLQSRGLVQALDNGAFTRANEARVVKQMPTMVSANQPIIAVITSRYTAKMAVDAMMDNKETFVRYTTVGESNVYTLGNIGQHRIVSTKLPGSGHTREAATAAGNAITRLLGTFQKVDFVILVGVAGGVAHYADYSKHMRLGDVVASYPNSNGVCYLSCDKHQGDVFDVKEYSPPNIILQQIAAKLKLEGDEGWLDHLNQVLDNDSEHQFTRPPPETDKLFMNVGDNDLIEVAHPSPSTTGDQTICNRVHLSAVASCPSVANDDGLRQKFSTLFDVLAFDSDVDAPVQSILGNRRDSFLVLRGISDYKDGSMWRQWQPFAALAAASVMKSILLAFDPEHEEYPNSH